MKIIVDTCIWSLALRRPTRLDDANVLELRELINESRAQLIGPVRQELLSGIKHKEHFDLLKSKLAAFIDLQIEREDYELAAEFYNTARGRGIQGSNTDFLLCALSRRHDMPIFTTDNDFHHFKQILPIRLHLSRFGR